MPLPLILGIGAAIAGLAGVGSGVHGAVKMKEANDDMKMTKKRHQENLNKFKGKNNYTTSVMDDLGKLELSILDSFSKFSDVIEKIQNRPEFDNIKIEGVDIPKFNKAEIDNVSIGAGVLIGGLGGAAVGTAGGFAAAGAATAAVMTLGVASTGTAISTLGGIAATNATLATLGGGALAAGGGGIALGTTILGASTLGVGLLVGGVIFNIVGGKISDKADAAWDQMLEEEKKINKVCVFLDNLAELANNYIYTLKRINKKYTKLLDYVSNIVINLHTTDWNDFSDQEMSATENLVLLVGLLYKMCKVKLVIKAENEKELNKINEDEINSCIGDSETVLNNTLNTDNY